MEPVSHLFNRTLAVFQSLSNTCLLLPLFLFMAAGAAGAATTTVRETFDTIFGLERTLFSGSSSGFQSRLVAHLHCAVAAAWTCCCLPPPPLLLLPQEDF